MMELCRYCLERRVPDASCGTCRGSELPTQDGAALEAPTWLIGDGESSPRYVLGRVLGSGGFGIAYVGMNLQLGLRVAIKELYPREYVIRGSGGTVAARSSAQQSDFEWARRQFVSEARTLSQVSDPRCVRVIDIVESKGTAYMVMELLEGKTLTEVRQAASGRLSPSMAVWIAREIAQGLDSLHRLGLLHRDVKPDNVILTTANQIKLIDFGAARFVGRNGASKLTSVFTAGYAPPEQMVDPADQPATMRQGPWSDIYSLGATIYELLTGQRPASAITRVMHGPADMRLALAPPAEETAEERALSEAVGASLLLDAAQRPQTVSEFIERLDYRGPRASRQRPSAPGPSAKGPPRSSAAEPHRVKTDRQAHAPAARDAAPAASAASAAAASASKSSFPRIVVSIGTGTLVAVAVTVIGKKAPLFSGDPLELFTLSWFGGAILSLWRGTAATLDAFAGAGTAMLVWVLVAKFLDIRSSTELLAHLASAGIFASLLWQAHRLPAYRMTICASVAVGVLASARFGWGDAASSLLGVTNPRVQALFAAVLLITVFLATWKLAAKHGRTRSASGNSAASAHRSAP